jgi:hypothetical protein
MNVAVLTAMGNMLALPRALPLASQLEPEPLQGKQVPLAGVIFHTQVRQRAGIEVAGGAEPETEQTETTSQRPVEDLIYTT